MSTTHRGRGTVLGIPVSLDELEEVEASGVFAVAEGLRLANEANLLSNVERVSSRECPHLLGEPIASFQPGEKLLYVSPSKARRDWLSWLESEDVLVGSGVEARVIHECVHAEQFRQLEEEELTDVLTETLSTRERRVLKREVSEYASEMPCEAVAEIGVLMVQGKPVSEKVRSIYERYQGPRIAH